jgi:PIN domain nuclease of toxin-antitoxin system
MKLLLDTHTLVWALISPAQVPPLIRTLLEDARNEVSFSAASILEIAIGRAAGRRNAPAIGSEEASALGRQAGYEMIPITDLHAAAVETIALFHADPYDKLLLAQAQIEGLRLVTHDKKLAAYDSRTILF